METNDKNNQTLELGNDENLLNLKVGGKLGVYKKSLRPSRSIKPFSFSRNKFKSVSRVQKTIHPQEKDPQSI